jgi:hypothetical protein
LLPQQLNSDHGEAICLRRPSIPSAAPSAPPSNRVAVALSRLVTHRHAPSRPSRTVTQALRTACAGDQTADFSRVQLILFVSTLPRGTSGVAP